MPWKESDNEKTDNCINRLNLEERKLNEQLAKIHLLKNGIGRIKTQKSVQTIDAKSVLVDIPPKDPSGDSMNEDYRLLQLEKIITKTDELLGPIEEVQDDE